MAFSYPPQNLVPRLKAFLSGVSVLILFQMFPLRTLIPFFYDFYSSTEISKAPGLFILQASPLSPCPSPFPRPLRFRFRFPSFFSFSAVPPPLFLPCSLRLFWLSLLFFPSLLRLLSLLFSRPVCRAVVSLLLHFRSFSFMGYRFVPFF